MDRVILQDALPEEVCGVHALPGIAPCKPDDWLRVDEAYAAQMAYREALLAERPEKVLYCDPSALPAVVEVLDEALKLLSGLGFMAEGDGFRRPDGVYVPVDRGAPLRTLGHLVQEDIVVLQKRGDEHVLTGAVLCFPANWRLAEKAGRPLVAIHAPVPEYDDNIARRVQRLFDGVKVGRPLWRFNRLYYVEADLHQPWRKTDDGEMAYVRSERQCVVRMPVTGACVFSIHTYVVPAEKAVFTQT